MALMAWLRPSGTEAVAGSSAMLLSTGAATLRLNGSLVKPPQLPRIEAVPLRRAVTVPLALMLATVGSLLCQASAVTSLVVNSGLEPGGVE